MSGDRTIAPGPGRIQRAWRAGLRPGARWLTAGAILLGLGVGIARLDPELSAVSAPLRDALSASGSPDPGVLEALVFGAVQWAAVIGLGAILAIAIATLVGPGIGPIDSQERERLGAAAFRPPSLAWLGLAVFVVAWAVLTLHPVLAGAARGVDASEQGLAVLWRDWPLRVCVAMGAAMLAAGLIELMLERRAVYHSLHQSMEQARQEIRERGGRRR